MPRNRSWPAVLGVLPLAKGLRRLRRSQVARKAFYEVVPREGRRFTSFS